MSATDGVDPLIAELLPTFVQEAGEQTDAIEQLLLQLEDCPQDHGLLDALFRCAHTIKGSAGVFGLEPVVAFTHHVETLLDRLRSGQLALSPALGTLLLQCNDAIRDLVATAGTPATPEASQHHQALVERLHAASGSTRSVAPADPTAPVVAATAASGTPRWHIEVRFGTDTFRHGMDPLTVLSYVGGLGELEALRLHRDAVPTLEALDPETCALAFDFELSSEAPREQIDRAFDFVREGCTLTIEPLTTTPSPGLAAPAAPGMPVSSTGAAESPARGPDSAAQRPDEASYIRVHAHRLDEVINLLGQLVIAGAGASMLARGTRQRELIEANQQVTRLIEGIRNSTLKLRMVPIGETFARFRRVVRDTAAELGKDVALELVGGDTELDKAVVERIADPLMHLVRNALDHGLETPTEREQAGKPAQGRLTLSACHESGSILIRIADDGRGIRREKVLERAWQRGLVEPGVTPPDNEILELIFQPGFSTAEQVTNLSGRGVGMDVVRRNIEALRGSITIESQPGAGSSIEIRLPLTLAIIDGFLVGVGPSRFIFPLDAVVEVISSRDATTQADPRGRTTVDLRGRLLPVIDLRSLYGLDGPPPERSSIVVVRIGLRHYGVRVDTLLGQHQTVIKPLGRLLGSLRGISGSSILGTGEVALIFDVDALGQVATRTHHALPRTRGTGEAAVPTPFTSAGERT